MGADKGYDTADFLADLRALEATPHVAQNISGRRSRIDARTTRHSGYEVKGVPFPVIARYLGHKDSRTTERVYAHHSPDYLEAVRRAIDSGAR